MDIFSCHSDDDLRVPERSEVKNVPVRRSKQEVIYRSGKPGRGGLLPLIKRNHDKLNL